MEMLAEKEMQELGARNMILRNKRLELGLLEREYSLFQKELFEKHGLESDKNYSIDQRGVISEVKQNGQNQGLESVEVLEKNKKYKVKEGVSSGKKRKEN